MGTLGSSPVSEADHLPPSSIEVKNEWLYTSSLSHACTACRRMAILKMNINASLQAYAHPSTCPTMCVYVCVRV